MDDQTLSDLPGIELDAEIVRTILQNGDTYRQQINGIAKFVADYRVGFREILLKNQLILTHQPQVEGFDLAAVDGASGIDPHGGGSLITATAYKASVTGDKQRGATNTVLVPNKTELEPFATLLRIHLELSLLTADKLDEDRLVILDHSFWGVMQAVSRSLSTYKTQRTRLVEAQQNPENDAMYQLWLLLFQDCLGSEGSFLRMMKNKQVISLSKEGVSQYFVNLLVDLSNITDSKTRLLASTLNDRALFRHLLYPGEYTVPQSLYRTVQEGGVIKSWKRSRFATQFEDSDGPDPFEARDAVLDEYGIPRDTGEELRGRRLFITYYRPYTWSRVYRIEFHERLLANKGSPNTYDPTGQGERFQRVLASVRQSINPETKEPLSQVIADIRSKAGAACALSILPERTRYQLWEEYRNNPEMLDILDTLIAEERT